MERRAKCVRLKEIGLIAMLVCLSAVAGQAHAGTGSAPGYRPLIAIVIDDLGNDWAADTRALALPGAVTYAFLPHTPYAARLARLAHALRREVLVHVPMSAEDGAALGPGGLTPAMGKRELVRTLRADIAAVPFASGVNNHMGSLLTRETRPMQWVMATLRAAGGLYFVDSRTTAQSVAYDIAREDGIPSVRRDVFLDDDVDARQILHQFERLVRKAKADGTALAIGHPHPATVAVLGTVLGNLDHYGVELVPVSVLTARHTPDGWRPRLTRVNAGEAPAAGLP